ncbi:DOMON-like domain-containing protein [Pleurocapsales cyanobacterium LEGE 10410]|nr:DOMON-like domain-containing protein [Pleurocapsales cyanobacterium LEGE 10410]
MKQSDFSLLPFSSTAPPVKITGVVLRQHNKLAIKYLFSGDLSAIIIPSSNQPPSRKYDLWDRTCCEFFIGIKDSTKYWEFNLAPTKDWNVFRFPNYRQDIAEEMAFDSLPFEVLQQGDSWQLDLAVDLNKIIPAEQELEVGITCVVEDRNKQLSYWALTHPASEADFHHRDSFTIELYSDLAPRKVDNIK